MTKSYCHTNETEQKILQRMRRLGYGSKAIQDVMGRSKAWVSKHSKRLSRTKGSTKVKKAGRKRVITPLVFDRLSKALRLLQKKSKGLKEVTVDMVKARARCNATNRTVLDAFHEKGIVFTPLFEKCILSKEDRQERLSPLQEFGSNQRY